MGSWKAEIRQPAFDFTGNVGYTDRFAFHALAILMPVKQLSQFYKHYHHKMMIPGSISHAFSCKHETHDLLTLVS